MKRSIALTVCAALVGLTGCGDYDHMKNNLDQMNDKTGQLSTDSCELYDALRQGNTLVIRRDSVNNLLLNTRQEAAKIAQAGEYFMAFEFQLWSNACQDNTQLKRDTLMAVAAQEFLRQVEEFFPDNNLEPDPSALSDGSPYSKDNLRASLNALSAAIHEINPKQAMRAAGDPTFKTYSMLDVLENGLAAKAEVNSGKVAIGDEPAYVKEVLLQEKYAVAVLQARYNMAVAVVVDGISNIRGGFFNKAMMYLSPWDADMGNLNMAQLTEFEAYIKGANEVHDFLKSIGQTPVMNKNFRRVLQNMRYSQPHKRNALLENEELRLTKMIQRYANEK